MFANTWNNIITWFKDRSERAKLIAPSLLKASMSKGDSAFKHQFSSWLNSGFRIQVFTGRVLTRAEIITIGKVILSDETLVRKLVILGWDTLEVHGDKGTYGCKWQLKDFILLPE